MSTLPSAPAPYWSTSRVTGPILVRFSGTEWNADVQPPRYPAVYVDVRSIVAVRENKNGGTRLILKNNVPIDLSNSCDNVIKRLVEIMKEFQ